MIRNRARCGWLLLALLWLIPLPHAVAAFTAKGYDNPTLALNLARPSDFAPAMQFLDIAKHMRPWVGHKAGRWGGMSYAELQSGGYIDPKGWVRSIPDGVARVGTTWNWSRHPNAAPYRRGVYVLTYTGSGVLELSGDVRVITRRPGRIVFENAKGGTFALDLLQTDPDGTGNYIRDISILHEQHLDLYAAGARFEPNWLNLIKDARVLRFMNWQATNNSGLRRWRDRSVPDGLFARHGVPLEYMVQLANEVGADPWFTMPHQADARYIRAFAAYVRTHLDPDLTIHVEYSNETWNWAFEQARWLGEQAQKEWGGGRHAYHTHKATEVAVIWDSVFGPEEAETRLFHVLASQGMNTNATEKRLEANAWRQNAPGSFKEPAEVFDALAIAHYFGSATVSQADLRTDLIAAIQNPNVDAAEYLTKRLTQRRYNGSLPASRKVWAKQARLGRRHGLALIGYEGGQHVHHAFAVKGLSETETTLLTTFMRGYIRSDEMGALYDDLWEAWAGVSGGPFMQFTELSNVSKWGSWGLRNALDDTSPRAELLDRRNAEQRPWWDAQPGPQYQHGVTQIGSDGPDRLIGTLQEDYLIGRGGDDVFEPGPGTDGVHGGAGQDEVRLPGAAAQYQIVAKSDHVEITGQGSRYRLVDIETVLFASGDRISLKTP